MEATKTAKRFRVMTIPGSDDGTVSASYYVYDGYFGRVVAHPADLTGTTAPRLARRLNQANVECANKPRRF